MTLCGGGEHDGTPVPECPEAYPQNTMFGVLPAAALYARHVRGLRLDAVEFHTNEPDARKAIVLDDVSA